MKQPFRPSLESPFDDPADEYTPRPPVRQAWWGYAVILALIFAIVLSAHFIARAEAQTIPVRTINCYELSQQAGLVVWARDMGAQHDKVLQDMRRLNARHAKVLIDGMDRELRWIWAQPFDSNDAMQAAYNRCVAQLGAIRREG